MNRIAFTLSAIIVLSLQSGCHGHVNPSAPTRAILLSDAQDVGVSEAQMKEELTRSERVRYRSDHSHAAYDLELEATLQTKAYIYQNTKEHVEKEAFEKRWDLEKKETEFRALLKERLAKADKQTCFLIKVETDHREANDAEKWHGDLYHSNGERTKVTFSEFMGFSQSETHVYASKYYAGSYTLTNYHLFSMACSDKAIDTTQEFSFFVMPRYGKHIKPMTLQWLREPATRGQNRAHTISEVRAYQERNS